MTRHTITKYKQLKIQPIMNTKSIIAGLGLLVAAYALGSCAKDDTGGIADRDGQTVTVSFGAVKEGVQDTKTVIEGNKTDGFSIKWEQSDRLGVYSHADGVAASALTSNAPFSISSLAGDVATFTGSIKANSAAETTFDIFAYYPYNSSNASTDYKAVEGNVPAEQTMTAAGSYDSRADYMVAKPGMKVTVTPPDSYTASLDNFQFAHLMAFTNFTVKAITVGDVAGTEKVANVEMEAVGILENPVLAGDFTLNLENGAMTWAANGTNAVMAICPDGMTLENLNAWFVTNPFTVTTDDELIVTITTDQHIIEKTVSNKALDFKANNITGLNLTIDASCRITKLTERTGGLTNDEIAAKGAVSGYQDITIPSASGDWTGNALINLSPAPYVQINTGRYLVSPMFTGKVLEVTIATSNNTASGRTLYITPSSYWKTETPTGSDVLGSASTAAANGSVTIPLTGNDFQFKIFADGLTCIESITVKYSIDPITQPMPLVMSDINVTGTTSSSITVDWVPVVGAVSYNYKLGEAGTVSNTADPDAAFENLTPSTEYTVYVQAVGDGTYYSDSPFATVNVTTKADAGSVTWTSVGNDVTLVTPGEYVVVYLMNADKGDGYYYLPNPRADAAGAVVSKPLTIVSADGSTLDASGVTEDMVWNFITSGAGFSVQSAADNTVYLGAANSNNGLRVGSYSTQVWAVAADQTYNLTFLNSTMSRYLCAYTATNWRTYKSVTNNYGKLYLFKKGN